MAVDEPDAGVVGADGDGNVAIPGEQDDVAARRVLEVEVVEARVRVELLRALGQDHDVVAVPVDRVSNCNAGILGEEVSLGVLSGAGEGPTHAE